MSEHILRDSLNRIIGRVEIQNDGKQVLRDALYRIAGSYDPKDDTTRDRFNRIIGRGNVLASLLT